MSLKLELGDLIRTRQWEGFKIEVCIFVGATGYLMYDLTTQFVYHLERYIKKSESLPYSCTIISKDSKDYESAMEEVKKILLSRGLNDGKTDLGKEE